MLSFGQEAEEVLEALFGAVDECQFGPKVGEHLDIIVPERNNKRKEPADFLSFKDTWDLQQSLKVPSLIFDYKLHQFQVTGIDRIRQGVPLFCTLAQAIILHILSKVHRIIIALNAHTIDLIVVLTYQL